MEMLIHPEIKIDKKRNFLRREESLELSYIESQLLKMGISFTPISWTDRFLIAEDLQNYFAEILASYSLLELMEEDKDKPDINKMEIWDGICLNVIRERKKYYQNNYNLQNEQQLLLWLMKEYKILENLRNNEI
jgi:hypothetical protein